MRFLEQRDHEFDIVKSFLVISMTVAHGFQFFYNHYYNRNLTYYVLVGFVFLSGLTVAGVYQEKLLKQPAPYIWAILSRALKLLGIFLLINTIIILLSTDGLLQFFKLMPTNLLIQAILGGEQNSARISFKILVAIGLTFVGSIGMLTWRRSILDLFFLVLGVSALWIIEITGDFNYYGVKMLIVGLIGVLSSKALISVNWEEMKDTLSKWHLAIWAGYIAYQTVLLVFNEEWDLIVRHYLNVTILLLSAIYLTSYRVTLISHGSVKFLNRVLAKHMLFAYLFHLCFLRILAQVIGYRNLDFVATMAVSLFVLTVTIIGGLSINALTGKYKKINRLYSLVFR